MIDSPLKWVGGKKRVKTLITNEFPHQFNDYHEPFLGSGAVFLHCKQNFTGTRNWFLSDVNQHLICWWKAIQSDLTAFTDCIKDIQDRYHNGNRKDGYHELRAEFNSYQPLDTWKAALFMFLSRTAFNGLIRYNSKGEFNSAWGNPVSGKHLDTFVVNIDDLQKLSTLLVGVNISCHSYVDVEAKSGDLIFADPPYVAVDSRRLDKSAYNTAGFNDLDQSRFSAWAAEQSSNGVNLIICNHDTEQVRQLYTGFHFQPYELMKSFSGKATSRIKTSEILMFNYDKN